MSTRAPMPPFSINMDTGETTFGDSLVIVSRITRARPLSERVPCENVIAMLKRFKIIADRYRNRRRRFVLRFFLIAARALCIRADTRQKPVSGYFRSWRFQIMMRISVVAHTEFAALAPFRRSSPSPLRRRPSASRRRRLSRWVTLRRSTTTSLGSHAAHTAIAARK